MNNKCNCGCQQGFVPVSSNWDFNVNGECDCGCQQNYTRRNRRSNSCACDDCEQNYARTRSSNDDCQCERCDDCREVECCDQNTYIRDMDDCDYNSGSYSRNRSGNKDCDECNGNSTYNRGRSNDCDKCESGYSRSRSTCSGNDDCQCENCTRTRNRSRRNSNGCDKDCDYNDESAYTRDRSSNCGRQQGSCCDKDDSAYNRSRSGYNGCDKNCDCNGESTYNRNRSGNCDCDKDNSAYNRSRSGYNGCDKDNASTYARSNKNRTVGMINVERQEIDEIFESESALRAGTLFPELHKPMNGYCPCDENCGTCAQASAFAAWELRLYLNTHPNDKEALKLFRKLCKEAEDTNYATTFLTDDGCTNGWDWVKNPWPWEYDCQCRSGSDCGD